MKKKLAGKVALITGSTAGIGRACAELFAEEGATVIINDHGLEPALGRAVTRQIKSEGGNASYFQADVHESGQVEALVRFALDTYGRLDILMNNAYSGEHNSVTEITDTDWDGAYRVIIKAAAVACRSAIPEMIRQGGGTIINTASVHGLLGARRNAPYNAFKAALINLTRQMAVDYGRDGIRVNALCPGRIVTEAKTRMLEEHPEEVRRQKLVYPLGRPGTMREIAQAALFLASDDSSFVTGHALVVDGGLTAQLQDSVGGYVDEALHKDSF
jgi:NAD(P)-dependent dehydrogenase (short-subunit alcohol dehydrogenase family)